MLLHDIVKKLYIKDTAKQECNARKAISEDVRIFCTAMYCLQSLK